MQSQDRDRLYLKIAAMFAEYSTCLRGHTGAVIVRGGRICGTGYNGAPPGLPHCTEVGCGGAVMEPRLPQPSETVRVRGNKAHANLDYVETFPHGCTRAVHAEANAVAYSARFGIPTEHATVYCTHSPCVACAQLLASSGIERLVFREFYRIREPLEMLERIMVISHVSE